MGLENLRPGFNPDSSVAKNLTINGLVDLGAIAEDDRIRITNEQLLKNSTDGDGDALSITGLKVSKGDGTLKPNQLCAASGGGHK